MIPQAVRKCDTNYRYLHQTKTSTAQANELIKGKKIDQSINYFLNKNNFAINIEIISLRFNNYNSVTIIVSVKIDTPF